MLHGTYEYSGIQRCGKSTVMVKDLKMKILKEFRPEDVFSNFRIFIDGVNCMETESLIDRVFKMKEDKERHKVIMFDEAGQFLVAREYKSKEQTRFVSFAWQMPKRDIIMMYASNVGNSADVILRDATWVTVMPKYYQGVCRELDYIKLGVIFNYECRVVKNIIVPGVYKYQELFDTYEPIE